MRLAACICIMLALDSGASAQLYQPEYTINLKGLVPLRTEVLGSRLSLAFTSAPPEISASFTSEPAPLHKPEPRVRIRQVRILFGADMLGDARISGSWPMPTERGKTSMKRFTRFNLTFATALQAKKAADYLKQGEALPTPLRESKAE